MRRNVATYTAVAVVALGIGAGIGYAVAEDVGPFAPAPLLVWGGEEFTDRPEFERWLA